jgi:hypothetical protein
MKQQECVEILTNSLEKSLKKVVRHTESFVNFQQTGSLDVNHAPQKIFTGRFTAEPG